MLLGSILMELWSTGMVRAGLMTDAAGDRPAAEAYITRATDRPAFRKAHADQMAHFAAANEKRTGNGPG